MTAEETAWVAGVIEGEGCFDANGTGRSPRVRIQMTDADIILRVHALVGGSLSYPRNHRPDKWKDSVMLTVGKRAEAEPLFKAIRPWMGDRRGAKLDEIMAVWP